MKRKQYNPHAELCAWANGLRPDSPQNDEVELDEWDEREEDGPMDLEDQLDAAFARADRQKQK